MTFRIDFSKESLKFIHNNDIKENDIIEDVFNEDVFKVVEKLKGKNVNIDLKKMRGEWKGFYRLRLGKKRIIFQINFNVKEIFIDRIDFRGDVYK